MNDLLISVRALGRPDYSKRCLDSLLANTDLDCDFLLVQDGVVNKISGEVYADEKEVIANAKVFLTSKLPNKSTFLMEKNVGGANVKGFIFNWAFPKYKYLMMLDNDLVVNKYYIKTIKTLFNQFAGTNAGMIQTSYRHYPETPIETLKFAKANENKVTKGFSHRWEQGFWRETWTRIKPLMKPFIEINARNDVMYLVKGYPHRDESNRAALIEAERNKLIQIYGQTTDDHALEKCVINAGFTGLHTLTLRHKSIGEKGQYTMDAYRFETEGFEKIKMFDVGNVDHYELV